MKSIIQGPRSAVKCEGANNQAAIYTINLDRGGKKRFRPSKDLLALRITNFPELEKTFVLKEKFDTAYKELI